MARQARLSFMLSILVLGLIQAAPQPAFAQTFRVNKHGDHAPGACNANDCTLREAVIAANARNGDDTILLGKGTYSLTHYANEDDEAAVGDLDITDTVTITGASSKDTIVKGDFPSQFETAFQVWGVKTTITDITVTEAFYGIFVNGPGSLVMKRAVLTKNGNNTNGGYGLFTYGPATLTNVEVTKNSGTGVGGIYSSTSLKVNRSLVADNGTNSGILSHDGVLEVTDSIIKNNTGAAGGGINSLGRHTISGSKIVGNESLGNGGGLFVREGTVSNTLITRNKADGHGGGIYITFEFESGKCSKRPLTRVTLSNNRADFDDDDDGDGGGVFTSCGERAPVLELLTVHNNSAFNGGGLAGLGSQTLVESTVSVNEAERRGGGLNLSRGITPATATVSRSLFVNNESGEGGGGIAADSFGGSGEVELKVVNSTITGNRADTYGGGIDVAGGAAASLRALTVTNNRADADNIGDGGGGGLQNGGTTSFKVFYSIIAGNSVGAAGIAPDCFGPYQSKDRNLIGSMTNCSGFAEPGDMIGENAGILPLGRNGGPTRTHAFKAFSPAVDVVPGECGILTDQRGVPRKDCDIGAYERATCEGVLINRVGTNASDRLTGTGEADGLWGGKGDDNLKGLDGSDGLCGNEGKDRLEGGEGKDDLNGGPQSDVCIGGPGTNTFANCETRRN